MAEYTFKIDFTDKGKKFTKLLDDLIEQDTKRLLELDSKMED